MLARQEEERRDVVTEEVVPPPFPKLRRGCLKRPPNEVKLRRTHLTPAVLRRRMRLLLMLLNSRKGEFVSAAEALEEGRRGGIDVDCFALAVLLPGLRVWRERQRCGERGRGEGRT